MNLLFRCDGSLEIGMGHVVRCLALADELKSDCEITFAMRGSNLGIDTVRESYPVITTRTGSKIFVYQDWVIDCIRLVKADVLILDTRDDLRRRDLNYIKRKTAFKVVSIDDPEDKRLEADLVFYPPVPQLKEMDWGGFLGKIYAGWEYVLLRQEILKYSKKFIKNNRSVLVSMGGSDPQNLTSFVVDTIMDLDSDLMFKIVLGPGYVFEDELHTKLKSANFNYIILHDPDNFPEIMSEADFAIISFGVTAYELAVMGIPAIYLCLSDDHVESANLFDKTKIGKNMGNISTLSKSELVNTINDFHNQQFLQQMKNNANNLNIDNCTGKVAEIIKTL